MADDDLREFQRFIRVTADKIQPATDNLVRQATISVATALINRTPVDVGTAVSNWRVSKIPPPRDVIPAHAPGKKGSTAQANRSIAISRVVGEVGATRTVNVSFNANQYGSLTSGRTKAPSLQIAYIFNNAPQVRMLNQGSSRSAPAGFIEAALAEAEARFARTSFLT